MRVIDDYKTREDMRVGAAGEWQVKPWDEKAFRAVAEEKMRVTRQIAAERKASQVQFKADPSQKPASTGPKPQAPTLTLGDVRRKQAMGSKANAGDVHGHTERQRALLPNKFDRPKKSALGLTTFGPAFKKPKKSKAKPKKSA